MMIELHTHDSKNQRKLDVQNGDEYIMMMIKLNTLDQKILKYCILNENCWDDDDDDKIPR